MFSGNNFKKKIYLYEPNLCVGNLIDFFYLIVIKFFVTQKIKKYPSKFQKKIFILSPLVRKNFITMIKTKSKFTLLVIGGVSAKYLINIFMKFYINYLKNQISKLFIKQSLIILII